MLRSVAMRLVSSPAWVSISTRMSPSAKRLTTSMACSGLAPRRMRMPRMASQAMSRLAASPNTVAAARGATFAAEEVAMVTPWMSRNRPIMEKKATRSWVVAGILGKGSQRRTTVSSHRLPWLRSV